MSRHCLITGGASGMGAATARLAAQGGYAVSIVSLEAERDAGTQLAHEIESAGGAARFFPADVSLEADIVETYARAAEQRDGPAF